jgi:hypothetical protein
MALWEMKLNSFHAGGGGGRGKFCREIDFLCYCDYN